MRGGKVYEPEREELTKICQLMFKEDPEADALECVENVIEVPGLEHLKAWWARIAERHQVVVILDLMEAGVKTPRQDHNKWYKRIRARYAYRKHYRGV